jgi:hypothetical protein
LKRTILLSLFLLWSLGCGRNNQTPIPYVPINLTIDISLPTFFPLQGVGNHIYIENEGSRGLILYRLSNEEFRTFDRHCPYQVNNSCGRLSVDDNGLFMTDTCCGSRFLIIDGSVNQGPAEFPALGYRTNFDGLSRVFIRN